MIGTADQDGIRTLSIAHGKANILDLEFFGGLDEALTAAETDDVEALVLTGSGEIFSAGVDLFKVLDGGDAYIDSFLTAMSDGFFRLFTFPRPVVAAVNGHAIAGGCILACACDFRVGTEEVGRIGVPELAVGVPFPASALEIMRAVVGDQRLTELVRDARTYPPAMARDIGLLDRLAAREALVEEALAEGRRLASIDARVFSLSKRQLRQDAIDRILRERPKTDPKVLALWKAPQTLAAIRRYLERTLSR